MLTCIKFGKNKKKRLNGKYLYVIGGVITLGLIAIV